MPTKESSSNPLPPKEFSKFLDLPKRLQVEIWRHAILDLPAWVIPISFRWSKRKPKYINQRTDRRQDSKALQSPFVSQSVEHASSSHVTQLQCTLPHPPIARVSRLARFVTFETLKPLIDKRSSVGIISWDFVTVNLEKDVLLLSQDIVGSGLYIPSYMREFQTALGDNFDLVRNLATETYFEPFHTDNLYRRTEWSITNIMPVLFPKLEALIFVPVRWTLERRD